MGEPANEFLTFWEFFSTVFVPLNCLELPLKHLHREVCEKLQAAVLGDLRKQFIVINIPPRVGKTKILEALACWMVAYFPDVQIIYTSYSSSLVERTIRYISGVLEKPWFTTLFGSRKYPVLRADLITTEEGGTIYGAGTSATITGFGGGLKREAGGFIAIDDPAKPDEALSPVEAENIRQWFETTIKSRRNSDQFCPIIICAQRLAPDDLPGYILQNYPTETELIKFPAMVDGESIIPETISTATLKQMEATRTGRFVLASQYQQEPIAFGGNLIVTDNFHRWDPTQAMQWDEKIITCDTALKAAQHNDFSVIECWGKCNGRAYLIDQARGHWESPELLENATLFYRKHNEPEQPVTRFTIEEKAAGIGLIQQLHRAGIPAIGIERTKDKVTRVHEILPYIETGMVFVPKDGCVPWIAAFLTECAQFQADGTSPHDDQVDTLCDGVWLLLGSGLSILDVLGDVRRSA